MGANDDPGNGNSANAPGRLRGNGPQPAAGTLPDTSLSDQYFPATPTVERFSWDLVFHQLGLANNRRGSERFDLNELLGRD